MPSDDFKKLEKNVNIQSILDPLNGAISRRQIRDFEDGMSNEEFLRHLTQNTSDTPKAPSKTFGALAVGVLGLGAIGGALFGIVKLLEPAVKYVTNEIDNIAKEADRKEKEKSPAMVVFIGKNQKFYAVIAPHVQDAANKADELCNQSSGSCLKVAVIDERKQQCVGVAAKIPFANQYIIEKFDNVKNETLSKRLLEERKKKNPEFVRASYYCNTPELQASVVPLASLGTYKGPYKSIDSVLSVFNNPERTGNPKNIYKNDVCVNVTEITNDDMFKITLKHPGAPKSGYAPQYQLRPAPECR